MEARRKTQDAALAGLGNRRLDNFHEGDEVWVQNRITRAWDRDTVVLGKHNGCASFSLFFTDTEQLSRQNEIFLRLKKSVGEIPKSDEQRGIASNVSHFPSTDCVSPSFNPHPHCQSERIRQKHNVKKLSGNLHVCFQKEQTIFHFDLTNIAHGRLAPPSALYATRAVGWLRRRPRRRRRTWRRGLPSRSAEGKK